MGVCLVRLQEQSGPCGRSRGMGREVLGSAIHGGSGESSEGLGFALGGIGWEATEEGRVDTGSPGGGY